MFRGRLFAGRTYSGQLWARQGSIVVAGLPYRGILQRYETLYGGRLFASQMQVGQLWTRRFITLPPPPPIDRPFIATTLVNTYSATVLATDLSRTARAVELQATVVQ